MVKVSIHYSAAPASYVGGADADSILVADASTPLATDSDSVPITAYGPSLIEADFVTYGGVTYSSGHLLIVEKVPYYTAEDGAQQVLSQLALVPFFIVLLCCLGLKFGVQLAKAS